MNYIFVISFVLSVAGMACYDYKRRLKHYTCQDFYNRVLGKY